MSGRALNALEQKLHQAAMSNPQHTMTQKESEKVVPDATARIAAINFLLGTGMIKLLTDAMGNTSFRAVLKKELDVKKDMSGEEAMVLGHIQASGNEGIWTKHIKAKTELHQTVLDRCLKSLVQKKLVKTIKSVKHKTRKLYMLYHLEPSVEITGGPWYTDNELDTEFIKLLCSACSRFIKDRSFPKQKRSGDNPSSPYSQPLYPISNAPSYPNAGQILNFLSKSKITETQLTVEHVEMLLNVLVLDGEVEKLPAFGGALWDSNINDVQDEESEDDGNQKKRKRKSEDDSRKRKRQKKHDSDTESESESAATSSKKKSKKKRKVDEKSDESSDGSEVAERKQKRKKRKVVVQDSSEEESDESPDEERSGKSKRKKKTRTKKHVSSSSSAASSATESDDDRNRRKKSRSRSRHSKKRSSSPGMDFGGQEMAGHANEDFSGGAYVYRAIRQEKLSLGLSESPCGRCPTFDFCKDDGPVNPQECVYYGDWLLKDPVAAE